MTAPVGYCAPSDLSETLDVLAAGARVIAGGTDLVVGARAGKQPLPERLVSIHRLAPLRSIDWHDGALRLGALVSHAAIVGDARIGQEFTALADSSAIVGSHATRSTGTIGGNLMNCSPAMDTGAPLLCLEASVVLKSVIGTRTLAVSELLRGPGSTTARPDELLTYVTIPTPAAHSGSAYVRLEYRRQMEIAVVGAAAVVTFDGDCIAKARIALSAVAPVVFRVHEAEDALRGRAWSNDVVRVAAERAGAAATPISDLRASASYRRAMVAVMVRRALQVAARRARGEVVCIPASDLSPVR